MKKHILYLIKIEKFSFHNDPNIFFVPVIVFEICTVLKGPFLENLFYPYVTFLTHHFHRKIDWKKIVENKNYIFLKSMYILIYLNESKVKSALIFPPNYFFFS